MRKEIRSHLELHKKTAFCHVFSCGSCASDLNEYMVGSKAIEHTIQIYFFGIHMIIRGVHNCAHQPANLESHILYNDFYWVAQQSIWLALLTDPASHHSQISTAWAMQFLRTFPRTPYSSYRITNQIKYKTSWLQSAIHKWDNHVCMTQDDVFIKSAHSRIKRWEFASCLLATAHTNEHGGCRPSQELECTMSNEQATPTKKRTLHRRIVSALKAHQRLDTKEQETWSTKS
jgi:hypothetical protein